MPRQYLWSDNNGPGQSVGQENPSAFMRKILKQCLVTGYAGKPAAGWSVVYETARVLYLQNPSGSVVAAFYDAGGEGMTTFIFLMENLPPNPIGDLPKGTNMRSGLYSTDYPGGIGYHCFGIRYHQGPIRWTVVADDRSFFFAWNDSSLIQPGIGSWTYSFRGLLYVGELAGGQAVALGGQGGNSQYNNESVFLGAKAGMSKTNWSPYAPMSTVLRNPVTGTVIAPETLAEFVCDQAANIYSQNSQATQSSAFVDTPYLPDEVSLAQPGLFYGNVSIPGGRIRGLVLPLGMESLDYRHHYKFLSGNDFSGTDDLYKPVQTQSGLAIPVSSNQLLSYTYWIMLDEAFW